MSESTALCSVCGRRHLSKSSIVWCVDCCEGLCLDCKEHHSLLKATRNHNIISITEYQQLPRNVLDISQHCTKHDEIFQTFCKKHDCPCCRKCVIETHNNCIDLIAIEDYTKDVKSSVRYNELEEMLNEMAENIKKIRLNRQENMASIKKERKRIEQDIDQMRIQFVNHLDKLQADVIQDLYAKEANEIKKMQEVMESLDEKQRKLHECQIDLVNIKKYASDVRLLLSMRQIEKHMVKNEEFIQSMIDSEGLYQAVLVLKSTIDTENVIAGMPFIGKVGVSYSPSLVDITKKKENQAQTMVNNEHIRSIKDISLKLRKKIESCEAGVTGCTFLPRGKMVFVNEEQRSITVVNSDGSLYCKIDFKPYVPHDITYIPKDNTIAITSSSSHYVKIIDGDTLRVIKILCVGSNCAGIAFTNGKLIVCGLEKGLIEVTYPGGSVKTILSCTMSTNSYLATLGEKIFYTDLDFGGVFCCDLKGNILWTFPCKNINSHNGVTVDNNGNVFVADFSRNRVYVISPNGQQHRDVLTSLAAVCYPIGLIYDRDNNQLLVTNYYKGAVLYTVT